MGGFSVNETVIGALRGRYIHIGKLFDLYATVGDVRSARKRLLALAICEASANTQAVERYMVYPGLREEDAKLARSLVRADLEMSARIACIRSMAGDEERDAAVVQLIESFRRKVWTHERLVFSSGQWRIQPQRAGEPQAAGVRS